MRLSRIAVLRSMRLDRIGVPVAASAPHVLFAGSTTKENFMRIFVTGASGWIGSAVVPELIGAGHQVLGLARSDASAKTVGDMGADVLRGDLNDTAVLRAGALGATVSSTWPSSPAEPASRKQRRPMPRPSRRLPPASSAPAGPW